MKISRNAPCPCGSGKKYKKCCEAINDNPSDKITNAQIEHLLTTGALRLCVDCNRPTGNWCDGCEDEGITDYPPFPNRPLCSKCEDKNSVCKYCRSEVSNTKVFENNVTTLPIISVHDDQMYISSAIQNAITLKRKGKFLEAHKLYAELDKQFPDHKDILFSWAKVKMLLGDYEEAKSMFSKSSNISAKYGLFNEVKICKQHIANLNFEEKNSTAFLRYLKEVAGNLNLEIETVREEFSKKIDSDEEVEKFYCEVEKISSPFIKAIEKASRKKNERIEKKFSINNTDKLKEESKEKKIDVEVNSNKTDGVPDYSKYFSKNTYHFFETAEFLYHSNLLGTLDYSCILTPYSKAVESEIYEKFLKKLESWCISSDEQIFIGSKEIKDFNLITLGQIRSLLFNQNVRDFINNNFSETSASFLLNGFQDITHNLSQIRNPNTHKSKTSKSVVESFRKILIDEEYLINIARLN